MNALDEAGLLRQSDMSPSPAVSLSIDGLRDVVLEQPVEKDDLEGLSQVSAMAQKYGIGVAADEACRSLEDAHRICNTSSGKALCDIINIKLSKVGVIAALSIVDICVRSGVELMIGGMVETRMGMGFAACFAAGLDCFKYVDLDTPLLLQGDVINGDKVTLCQSCWTCNAKHSIGGLGLSIEESLWLN